MNTIISDLSDQQAIVTAIEENMFSFWLSYGRVEQQEVYEDATLRRFTTGIPFPLCNGVFGAQLNPEALETTITSTLDVYASRRLPMVWWTGPATRPSNLGDFLQARGLHAGSVPGMAADLSALPDHTATAEDFVIRPVEDRDTLKHWIHIASVSNQIPEALEDELVELEARRGLEDNSPRLYIGWYRGKPVASSALHLDWGVAGLYTVATLPEARGNGFGSAISLQPMLDARAMGYRVGVLQASSMGFNVYRKLGFETYCQLGLYFFQPN